MIKRFFTLLKELLADLLGTAERKHNKHRNPVTMLHTGIKQIEAKQKEIERQYTECHTNFLKNEKIIKEKKEERDTQYAKAKKFKESGDEKSASHALTMVVRLDDWILRNSPILEKLRDREKELEATLSKLVQKIQEYKLELSLVESSSALANGKLTEYESFGVDFSSIDEILKDANDKIDETNFRVDAQEKLHDVLGKNDEAKEEEASQDSRVSELYKNL